MKYRIKITTHANGRKEYRAHVKNWFWTGLDYEGKTNSVTTCFDTIEQVLKAINLHYSGNNTVQRVEFEYINK